MESSNLKVSFKETNGAWTSPSMLVLLVGWGGGGEQNALLDNWFPIMSDCIRTSSALLTSHHIVKNVVKKV